MITSHPVYFRISVFTFTVLGWATKKNLFEKTYLNELFKMIVWMRSSSEKAFNRSFYRTKVLSKKIFCDEGSNDLYKISLMYSTNTIPLQKKQRYHNWRIQIHLVDGVCSQTVGPSHWCSIFRSSYCVLGERLLQFCVKETHYCFWNSHSTAGNLVEVKCCL